MNAGTIFPLAPGASQASPEPPMRPAGAIDNGSQSFEGDDLRCRGHALASAQGGSGLRAPLCPGERSIRRPHLTTWDSSSTPAREAMRTFRATPGHRGRRPADTSGFLPGPLAADGARLSGPELDGRARRAPRRPAQSQRHHVLRLHHPPPDRPVHRHRRQLRGRLAPSSRHGGLVGSTCCLRRRRHVPRDLSSTGRPAPRRATARPGAPRSPTPPVSAQPSAPPSATASTRTGIRPRRRWSAQATASPRTPKPPAPTSRSTRCNLDSAPLLHRPAVPLAWLTGSAAWGWRLRTPVSTSSVPLNFG